MSENILVQFKQNGTPKIGLTPLITIRLLDGNIVINDDNMQEIQNGWYEYVFIEYDKSKTYLIDCDGGETLAPIERYFSNTNILDSYSNKEDWKGLYNNYINIDEEEIVKKLLKQLDINNIAKELKQDFLGLETQLNNNIKQIFENIEIMKLEKGLNNKSKNEIDGLKKFLNTELGTIKENIQNNKLDNETISKIENKLKELIDTQKQIKKDVDLSVLIDGLGQIKQDVELLEDKLQTANTKGFKRIIDTVLNNLSSQNEKMFDIMEGIDKLGILKKLLPKEENKITRNDGKNFYL